MMTDDAANTGAENAVMARIVPADFRRRRCPSAARRLRGAATQPAAIKRLRAGCGQYLNFI
jgi:hypothetical protein